MTLRLSRKLTFLDGLSDVAHERRGGGGVFLLIVSAVLLLCLFVLILAHVYKSVTKNYESNLPV